MAAKKSVSPSEMTVAERLQKLYQLQTVLTKIDEIRTVRGELPLEVQDLENEVEGLHSRIVNAQEDVKNATNDINRWQEEKRVAQDAIARSEEKLDHVQNSREYDALTKEIEYQELEIQLRDKRINKVEEERQARQATIEESEKLRAERIEELEHKKGELDSIIAETKMQEDSLREDAQKIEGQIEPRLLQSFKRIRSNSYNGLGIVTVDRDACGGCLNKIPPQRQIDVRMRKKIIVCEYCGRILIDPELAGVETTEEKEPAKKPAKRTTRRSTTKKTTTKKATKPATEEKA